MKTVNKLGYKINSSKTPGPKIELLIDKKPLLDILEEAFSQLASNEKWVEKNDSRVVTKELKKSYKNQGEYAILTCAHCKMTEDLLLSEFKVFHQGEFVFWKVNPPGADVYYDHFKELEFKFHKPQYQTVIDRLIEDEMRG